MKQTRIVSDLRILEEFTRKIGGDLVARVGILGSDAGEDHDGMTNSEIGLIHEFGSESRNIPPRSFLRMPVEVRQATIVHQMTKPRTRAKIETGDIEGVFKDLGMAAEAVIQGAFTTRGFGKWVPNAPATVAAKGSSAPLIDTGQLRRAITSDVVKRSKI